VALCHEVVWRSGSIAPPFLTSPVNGDEWSALRPVRFTPGERAAVGHWIGGLRAGLDAMEKRKIFGVEVLLRDDTRNLYLDVFIEL
jgi:hypothetical protein